MAKFLVGRSTPVHKINYDLEVPGQPGEAQTVIRMDRGRGSAVVLALLMFIAPACTNAEENGGSTSDTAGERLPVTAGDGPMLCGFVPEDSVLVVLGQDEVTGDGEVAREQGGGVSYGTCRVLADGAPDPALEVDVFVGETHRSDTIRSRLEEEDFEYVFPEDVGEGYAFEIGEVTGSHGMTGRGGAVAALLWGESMIVVTLNDHAEGRAPVADVVALAQQVVDSLELPEAAPRTAS